MVGARAGGLERVLAAARRASPRPVRSVAKAGFRAIGYMTAWQRQLPDFLVVGAKRGGTTSLFSYLTQHPEVASIFPSVQGMKDVRFFDSNFRKGTLWYRSHFPSYLYRFYAERLRNRRLVAGESTPYYLFHPLAPRRAHRVVPHARLVILLRNPVDRAYSHYKDEVKNGREPLTFEEAIAQEPARLEREWERIIHDPTYNSFALEHHSYLAHGVYVDQLKRWLSLFPLDQVAIFRSEDFYADPADVYRRVLTFLGLSPWDPPVYERHNFLPSADISPRTREELSRYFAPHNQRLRQFLGLDFDWDPGPGAAADTPVEPPRDRTGRTGEAVRQETPAVVWKERS